MSLGAAFQVHLDTAKSLGYGIFFRGRWCAGVWPPQWHEFGITRDLTFVEFFFPNSWGVMALD